MNTTEKGNNFEDKALEIIEKILSEGELGLLSELVKIRKKHKYYSETRKGDINVDLAIEVWTPGAKKHTLLYIVECKDYKTRVPATKLEAFHSQLKQLNAHKGIFISNSPLQRSAYNIADSLGIMFIQGESSEKFNIILHKSNRSFTNNCIPKLNSIQLDEGTELITKIIDNQITKAFKILDNEDHISYGIDRLSSSDIEQICNNLIDEIDPNIRINGKVLKEQQLVTYIQDYLKFTVVEIENNETELGYCDFENAEIGLDPSLKFRNRKMFVLAHEVGHIILHSKLKIGQEEYNRFEDSKFDFKIGKHDLTNPKQWIEWQANQFAEHLLLNDNSFKYQLHKSLIRNNFKIGKIYLDDQIDNQKRFKKLTDELSDYFNVSKTTIIYKLKSINLLEDRTRMQIIGQIIHENDLYI